jgi:hypothetical protein
MKDLMMEKPYTQRNYESDYDDRRFSNSTSTSRYRPEYRPSGRERHPQHTAPALETRRRMFEREQLGGRRWEPEYSDSYSDVEFKRHYANDTPRDRGRERERERVTEYRRLFQQPSPAAEDFRMNKTSMRRQDSSTSKSSQEYSFNRHYPEGLFETYRSRFEVTHLFYLYYLQLILNFLVFCFTYRRDPEGELRLKNPLPVVVVVP